MNQTASIKIFLRYGDPKRLRTAEISNWTGKAIAAPRSDLDELLAREELINPGVYFLLGNDIESGDSLAYIGEAETVFSRLKQHKEKEFWNNAIIFVSKDKNLTKSHIRYLEGRLIEISQKVGRYKIENAQSSGAKLPEADLHEMEVFLDRISQLLPILGTDLLTPYITKIKNQLDQPHEISQSVVEATEEILQLQSKGVTASGMRTPNGFVIFKGSNAVNNFRESASNWVIKLRDTLTTNGTLINKGANLEFIKDAEFSSPSAAAAVIVGGNANGLTLWRNQSGTSLKEIEGLDIN